MREEEFDVAVVGASIAGCTAATLFAREGARVALLESHADPDAYKHACTHMIQSSANGVLGRLGVAEEVERAGGVRTAVEMWTEHGWIVDAAWRNGGRPAGRNLCVRRSVLDPILRRTAAATPGVELMLGRRVTAFASEAGTACGVDATGTDGKRMRVRASLVVAADGRASAVATLARVPRKLSPNARVAYFAYYSDLPLATGSDSQVWLHGTDVAYAFPAGDGLTLLAAFPSRKRLDEFKQDRTAALESTFAELERAPDIAAAERVTPVQGRLDLANVVRPAAMAGLALVGDAAIASDPVVGVGCGWAFQSAEWLVEETAAALLSDGGLDAALKRYRTRHRVTLNPHQAVIAQGSKARLPSRSERMLFSAAAKDPQVAERFHAYATRNIAPRDFLGPRTMMRAAWVDATRRRPAPLSSG
jgi:2-polyprenyl-6-methoxyphenol hydroxylase-like FAD-dependent oxidoreductase